MNLQATHADPMNTSLLASENDYRPLYQITTHTPLMKEGTTTITKVNKDSSTRHVAQIEWHSLKTDVLRFEMRGVNGSVKDYIGKAKTMSTVRQFTSANGHQYKWDGSVLKSTSGDEVARWHREHYGLMHKKHSAFLEISQDLLRHVDLDEIVVTWAYCQALIQKRWVAASEAAVAGGSSAGVAVAVA